MKIACIDKTAADRLSLQERLEHSYFAARSALGHLPIAHISPVSKEELLIDAAPDAALVGPGFSVEEASACCREITSAHPALPLIIIVRAENFSLRTLRRFEQFSREIFSAEEDPTRLLHALCKIHEQGSRRPRGKLLVIDGVKGGVGASSIAGALAHSAESLGHTAAVLDLSQSGALVHYMAASRWQSSDLATMLVDIIMPDETAVGRCTVTAPNGVHLFLPPAGSNDIRELWLRDPKRLEISLSCVDLLLDRFEVVIIDTASSEGVLPFALRARAYARLLVTSNEPAAVHLLSRRVSELRHAPGDGAVHILVNCVLDRGLSKEDVTDFLVLNKSFNEEMARLRPIPFDSLGRNWIGTGNTFYTESRRATQRALDFCFTRIFTPEKAAATLRETSEHDRISIATLARRLPWMGDRPTRKPTALPLLAGSRSSLSALKPRTGGLEALSRERIHEESEMYQPPSLVISGS